MNHVESCSGFWVALTYIIKTSLKLQGSKIIPTLKKATDGLRFLTANPSSSPRLFFESLTQEMRSINAQKKKKKKSLGDRIQALLSGTKLGSYILDHCIALIYSVSQLTVTEHLRYARF